MTSRTAFAIACALLPIAVAQDSTVPPDAEIRMILVDRVGAENLGSALVVGVIDPKGRRVISFGSLAKDDKRTLNSDTVFEIGSITKVFTSLVLMDMVQKGEVSLTDPVTKYLPATAKIPERNDKKITLQDLSTQSSGLPRMPSNFAPKDNANPYIDYSIDQLYQFLAGYQLTRDIGAKYEYSNLGVGLLGYALTRRAGVDYEAMVRTRICEPLGMNDTRVTLTPEMKARLAVGHSSGLAAVSNWDLPPAFAGAGAIRSTVNDMLTFLAANLGITKTPLAAAMAAEASIRRPTGTSNMEIAYAWHVLNKDGKSIIWHNGGTGGYRTWMGYDPQTRTGVVVFSNVSTPEGPDDIGRHLLDASYPLAKVEPIKEHKEITIDNKVFDSYLGSFQLAPNAIMAITREGNQLFELTGQPKAELFPEGDKRFFLKVVDAQISFDTDAQGKATQLTLHQNGRDTVARRVDEREAAAILAAIEKRFKDQKPAAGTEAAVRRSIEELRVGHPKYELMSPAFADVTRKQLPQLKELINHLGAVQSVAFKGVGKGGADIYEIKFEQGSTEWRITLDPDGKTAGMGFRQQ